MSSTSGRTLGSERMLALAGAAVHVVVATVLILFSVGGASILLPVVLTLPAPGEPVVAPVDLAAAAAVVLLVSAAAQAVRAAVVAHKPGHRRWRAVRFIELSQVAGITLFLFAQLNGVAEAAALILCYAVAAGAIGVLWLHDRGPVEHRGSAWPYSLGAALAIVPWGIVGLSQVSAIIAATPPPPLVRVLTIVVLLLAAAVWFVERRWQTGRLTDERVDGLHTALTLANGVALLAIVVGSG